MQKRLVISTFIMFVFLAMISFVSADNVTYVNVSIEEKAFQNVTFARDFWLEENVTNKIVHGYVNVSNPSQETVSDILIYLDNMTNLATNFSHMSGRMGNQLIVTDDTDDDVVYSNLNITPMPLTGIDLDHDNRTDYMFLYNETHIAFDLSTEYDYIFIDSGVDMFSGEGIFSNIEDTITMNDGTDVGYFFSDQQTTDVIGGLFDSVTITEYTHDFVTLHIRELLPGEYSLFNYTATSDVDPPIDVDTNYTHEQYRKVLAGECFNVTQWATNNFAYEFNMTDVNITIDALGVTWNDTVFNFTLFELMPSGDYGNVTKAPGENENKTWYWIVNNGTMEWGETYNISYSVCAPASVPYSDSYAFIKESLQYQTDGTISGIAVTQVLSVANTEYNFTKRIDKPSDTLNNTVVTWEVIPKITTVKNITYNVTKMSFWITEDLNPNNRTTLVNRTDLNMIYFPNTVINETRTWTGSEWFFNYTDGSSLDSPPPIIWMYPYFKIADVDDQLTDYYLTKSGEDLYWKYIYVVNGYWLEIEKNVTNVGEDSYNITVDVVNRGNGYTPSGLTVTVYDFVPGEFEAYGFNPAASAQRRVYGVFNGTAYRWDIPPERTTQNASFAPRGEINSTWNTTYIANGTGDYRISELFIVGLDPRLVDGGSAHEAISVVSSMATHTTEMVYVVIVLFLVGLNITNFMISRKKEKGNK
ncbi:MAG: hypothetical protein ACLFUO_02480 [Candidatus Woesearchaeota archaeon]